MESSSVPEYFMQNGVGSLEIECWCLYSHCLETITRAFNPTSRATLCFNKMFPWQQNNPLDKHLKSSSWKELRLPWRYNGCYQALTTALAWICKVRVSGTGSSSITARDHPMTLSQFMRSPAFLTLPVTHFVMKGRISWLNVIRTGVPQLHGVSSRLDLIQYPRFRPNSLLSACDHPLTFQRTWKECSYAEGF
jgi:hypothetical protein